MLNVTEGAKQMLKEALVANTNDPETGLRLVVDQPGLFTMVLDQEKKGDQVVAHEGLKVLLVDRQLSRELAGETIDREEGPERARLVMSKE